MERQDYIDQMNQRIAAKPGEDAAWVRRQEQYREMERLGKLYFTWEGISIDEAWFIDDDQKDLLKAVRVTLDGSYERLGLSNPAPTRGAFNRAAAEYYAPPGNSVVARLANSAFDSAFEKRARVREKQEAHQRDEARIVSDWTRGGASEAKWRIKLTAGKYNSPNRDSPDSTEWYLTLFGSGTIMGSGNFPYDSWRNSPSYWVDRSTLENSIVELFDKNQLSL